MSSPVDPTTTSAWARLSELRDALSPDLRAWFAADPDRAQRFTYAAGDLHVDLSKNLLSEDILAALVALGEQVDLPDRRDAMFAGERINVTEGRSVLHTALRRPQGQALVVDGQDVDHDVHEVLGRVHLTLAPEARTPSYPGFHLGGIISLAHVCPPSG